jgi:hypothetical protein
MINFSYFFTVKRSSHTSVTGCWIHSTETPPTTTSPSSLIRLLAHVFVAL